MCRNEAVGAWLGGSDNALLKSINIYPQGSLALGTAVRPLARNSNKAHLSRMFKSVFGINPGRYRALAAPAAL